MARMGTSDRAPMGKRPARAGRNPRLIVMGRQGAGKGTQCTRLAVTLGITHIDVGDVLRNAVRRRTPLGRAAEHYLQEGRLLPDEIVTEVVCERIGPAAGSGFVLDGFPRTLAQAEAIEDALGPGAIDLVVNLAITPKVAVRRLSTRRVCELCGSVTSFAAHRPSCTDCGGRLFQRDDDTVIAIRRRLAAYEHQTRPVLDWYAGQGRLVTVDGRRDTDDVTRQVLDTVTDMWATGAPGLAATPTATATVAG